MDTDPPVIESFTERSSSLQAASYVTTGGRCRSRHVEQFTPAGREELLNAVGAGDLPYERLVGEP